MKQGNLTARIVMLVVLAALLICLAVTAWQNFRVLYTTVLAYSYSVDDSLEATGILVREETVLPAQGGTVEVLPDEGEKVNKGGTVALLYQSDAGISQRETIQQLTLERDQLEYALSQVSGGSDSAQLSQQVTEAMAALRGAVASGDLTGLERQSLELKSLVYKRSYTFGETDTTATLQASLDSINAQIDALSVQSAQSTSRVTAAQSGVFSALVDGYESLITPDMLSTMTPDSTWYFVCGLPEKDAQRLVEGRSITVRFSRDWAGKVDMKVERLADPENGQVLVVLSTDKFLSDTTLLRRQTVELIFDTVTGIRLPKEALRVDQQTYTDEDTGEEEQQSVTGVYALVGQRAEFKEVSVLAEEENYILVKPVTGTAASQQKKALRAGDQILISTGELYDGKVIE